MSGVTKWDRIPNERIRGRTGVKSTLSYRAEQRGLKWFGHDGRMTKRVMNSEAEGTRSRGRPKLGWMEGVTNSLRASGLSVEEGRVKA